MQNKLKIRFRLLSLDEREPTARQRGRRVITEMRRRGIDAGIYESGDTADIIVGQHSPYDAKALSGACDYYIADNNDAMFLPTHPDFKSFWANADYVDYWCTGSQRIADHHKAKFGEHVVSYMREAVDTMYDGVGCDIKSKDNNIICMGFVDNIIFVEPLIPILNKLYNKYKFDLKAVYPRYNRYGVDNETFLSEAKFPHQFIEWTPESLIESIEISNIAITPLFDNEWTRCKSANKAVTFAWCGLPVIASNIESYHELITDGVSGRLAQTPEEWEAAFIDMFDFDKRVAMAKRGQEIAKRDFSIDEIVNEWERVISKVML